MGSDFLDKLGDGAAVFGKIQASVGAVVGIIVGICFIAIGIYLFRNNDDDLYENIDATVVKPTCAAHTETIKTKKSSSQVVMFKCLIPVKYSYLGKEYSSKLELDTQNNYVDGERIKISVLKSDPTIITQSRTSSRMMASLMIFGGLVAIGLSVGFAVLTFKNKNFAAFSGTVGAADMIFD